MPQLAQLADSRWPHRWAVVLACATFPLVWVGGLVTTTDAGMAVPDWPNTYGYNLFLYPWTTWLSGPWDLFVEHGHRLLAASVGMLTIALLVATWKSGEPNWMRGLAAAALALVVFQGVLGGMRVLLNERTLALLHGCTGPLFFALAVAIAVVTSAGWRHPSDAPRRSTAAGHVLRLAVVTCILAYLQIVLGAVLRHVPVEAEPGTFALAVKAHLLLAGVLLLHIVLLVGLVVRYFLRVRALRNLALLLGGLIVAQLLLGASTWLVKYSVPHWASTWIPSGTSAIQDGSWLQTHVITAHVAAGSLILVTSLSLALYSLRLLAAPQSSQRVTLTALKGTV